MAKIIVMLKDKVISEVALDKTEVTIGRDSGNDIYLKNPSVSREHAKIIKKGKIFYVEDLESTNGTYVNDVMVGWRSGLNDDDKITVGKYMLLFKESEKGTNKKEQQLMPEFMDSTIKVSKKRT